MESNVIELYDFWEEIKKEEIKSINNIFELDPPLDLHHEKSNIILSGQTRSGKTTLLHSLLRKGSLLHGVKP